MNMYDFYTGKAFDAYEYLGAHTEEAGTIFRAFAPNAERVSVIGDFNAWTDTPMEPIYDGNFYECRIAEAKVGMRYKLRVYRKDGRFLDHCDPYGFGMELRPQNASYIRALNGYSFHDSAWMCRRGSRFSDPLNIYEVHPGSWRKKGDSFYSYTELAERLIPYARENGYNYIELMPLCEYPCDASWGYQTLGFFSPTSRYGTMDELKALIDQCHQAGLGVLLDIALVHFAVDDFGLAEFDGTALYEYPSRDIAYNEWGSKNFAHSRGEVRSFLQSSVRYWLKEYHFDGVRMDAVSNLIYWQGDAKRGVNQGAVHFIRCMNAGLKAEMPDVLLIAEDSTNYPGVTGPASEGGLGFDYKWDMGWMNDTLAYFAQSVPDRIRDYHRLTFSMHYYYNEKFLLPLSHDEVVHGKAAILQKMHGDYADKFPQARCLYMYMYAHPGKKLTFMGNEIGQLREWDEKREQDWDILRYPKHDSFWHFMRTLNKLYLSSPALWENDYRREGFQWLDCEQDGTAAYAFLRKGTGQTIAAIFNFGNAELDSYRLKLENAASAALLLDSDWERFGGNTPELAETVLFQNNEAVFHLRAWEAKYYRVLW